MGSVFAMQGFGQLGGALVMLCCVAGFKGSLSSAASYAKCTGVCAHAVDQSWRVLIGKSSTGLTLLARLTSTRVRCRSRMHRALLPSHHPRNSSLYLRYCS